MKPLVLSVIVAVLCLSFVAYADRAELVKDGQKTKINGFAPNGAKDISLGVASQTVDMRNDVAWSVNSPVDCKYRTMSTATKAGRQKTIIASSPRTLVVNTASPFINFSGCTLGELERQ